MAGPESPKTSARVAFHHPGFVRFQLARFCIVTSTEMQSVAVGWQVYEITRRPLDLGLAGLAQFLPGILLFLVAGHVADRFERRKLIVLCYSGFALCSALLLCLSLRGINTVYPIYAVLVFLGVIRSLNGPVSRALLPQLVPEEHFPSAIAWASSVFQFATILGPSLGGVVYAAFRGPSAVYTLGLVAATFAAFATLGIKTQSKRRLREPVTRETILAGLRYIWREKVILGSISLDLFAVLLGGSAPRIRPRNPADRPVGPRPPPQRTWSGCSRHGHPARLQTVEASRWNDDAVVRRWVRRRDHPLRSFP